MTSAPSKCEHSLVRVATFLFPLSRNDMAPRILGVLLGSYALVEAFGFKRPVTRLTTSVLRRGEVDLCSFTFRHSSKQRAFNFAAVLSPRTGSESFHEPKCPMCRTEVEF